MPFPSRSAITCLDWHSGLLATGSLDSTVKLWHCNEFNCHRPAEKDHMATLKHQSQVRGNKARQISS